MVVWWIGGMVVAACLIVATGPLWAEDELTIEEFAEFEEQRNGGYAEQLNTYLKHWLIDEYPARAGKAWNRDYSSEDAFLESVEPNRARWRDIVIKPPTLEKRGGVQRTPHPLLKDLNAEWLIVPLDEPLTAEGLLVIPASATPDNPAPLVIAQHGIGSSPERTFGLLDDTGIYHAYARRLVEEGFAVLAPMNLRYAEWYHTIPRLCRLANISFPGIDLVRMQHLLNEVLPDPRIDAGRVGIWGISWGGLAAQFWMPLEPRIKAGISCAFFIHRRGKMADPGDKYSTFDRPDHDHAYFNGWLTEFTDADVVSLICPRPFMVQTGKQDSIGDWHGAVEEFEAARVHYDKLDLSERVEQALHEGGHEIHLESGLRFMKTWLRGQPE